MSIKKEYSTFEAMEECYQDQNSFVSKAYEMEFTDERRIMLRNTNSSKNIWFIPDINKDCDYMYDKWMIKPQLVDWNTATKHILSGFKARFNNKDYFLESFDDDGAICTYDKYSNGSSSCDYCITKKMIVGKWELI